MDKFGRIGVVGVNATDLGGGEEDGFWLFGLEERCYGMLVGQIGLVNLLGQEVGVTPERRRRTMAEPTKPFASYI